LTVLAAVAFVAVACKQEAAPPPMPAPAPAPMAPQAAPMGQAAAPAAPAAPTVVYASAEPQHGGVTQKVGDYMVELATGSEGKVDFYVTKYEGATPAFEKVSLGVLAKSATETDEDGAPLRRTVVFYPKDGKLQGTVAGMEKGAYNFDVSVYEIETETMAEGTFENVEIDPLETEMEAKHNGTVYVIEKTKMEVVQEGGKLKVYLRGLDDKALGTEGTLEDVTVGVGDENEETIDLEPVGDHYEGDIESEVPEDGELELVKFKLKIWDEDYDNLRAGPIPKYTARVPDLKLTKTEAKKLEHAGEMKGTIGTMKVAKPAKGMLGKPVAEPSGKKTKKSKGPKTKGKKAGEASGKKTKKSKGPKTKGKKAK
jgi:hypothetical protein